MMTQYQFIERRTCPACESRKLRMLWNSSFTHPSIARFIASYYEIDPRALKGAYKLDECIECGLIFQAFVGDPGTLAALYSSWAPTAESPEQIETYAADMKDVRGSRDAHELMTASAFLRMPITAMKVLDYGMGWGLWPVIARTLGCAAYGTELSPKMIENARANGVRAIGDEEIAGHQFDFINLEQSIEHVTEPLALLRRLGMSLSERGILKLSLPNASVAKRIIELIATDRFRGDYETIMPIQPLEHINSFSPNTVSSMARAAGLRAVRPSLAARYAFLWRGGIPRTPKRLLKEIVRPFWQYHNRRNIYVWLTRA